MRNRQNTLLAGVAALALIAGAGVASAQQNPQGKTESPGMSDQRTMHFADRQTERGHRHGAACPDRPDDRRQI